MKVAVPFLLLQIFFSLISLSGCAGGKPEPVSSEVGGKVRKREVVPFVGSFKVNRFVLENGLRLLVVEDHSSPTFAYHTWFRVGSRNEVPNYTGLAHLFEHLMFKGTKNHKDGEFDKILEGAGVEEENAFTSRDYTAYVQELPKSQLELIAQLESDRMVNLIVDTESFKTEREVVQNERRFREDNNPDGLMSQALFRTAFTVHPYRWPVIGSSEDLERMTADDAVKFYHSYYSPNHATIIVAGDVDPDQTLAVIQKYYGELPGQPAPANTIPAEPPQTAIRKSVLKLNIEVEKLLMAYHIPAIIQDDIPALQTLMAVLTGGKSSRLYQALVETGIASGVDTYDLEDKDPSLLTFIVNLQNGHKATQAESVILRELRKLSRELVSDDELTRVRNRMSFGFYEGLDSNFERAGFLGRYEALAGDFSVGLVQFKKSLEATSQDLQAVAKRYLDPKTRTVVIGTVKGRARK